MDLSRSFYGRNANPATSKSNVAHPAWPGRSFAISFEYAEGEPVWPASLSKVEPERIG
jgi:hypothetical protein